MHRRIWTNQEYIDRKKYEVKFTKKVKKIHKFLVHKIEVFHNHDY